jgi:glycosyltransferase involved in cell wall biosynthesis
VKILQVIPYFFPALTYGGPVKVAYDVSKELVKRGHEVTVYTSDLEVDCATAEDRVKEFEGIRVCYFRNVNDFIAKEMKLFITPDMSIALKNNIQRFDVIHVHEYRTFQSIVVQYYARKYRVPYVLQAHGALPRISAKKNLKFFYDALFGYRLLKDASKVIALTPTEVQQYLGTGVSKRKIEIVPNGINLSEYIDLPSKGRFRKKYGVDEKIVLYLGRINSIKGIDVLVRAFKEIIEVLDDAKLVIVGPDDGYLRELELLIRTLRIENNVLIVGPLYGEDKLEAYVDADVYVLPSRYEIWGLTALEAYACGKPVVVSKVGGLAYLVIDGITGFSVAPGNVRQLADAILVILSDDDRAKQMGSMGKSFVKENFDIQKTIEELESLYRKVLLDAHNGLGREQNSQF